MIGERLTVAEFERCHVETSDGWRLGRVFDVRVCEHDGEPPRVESLLVGAGGLLRRLGLGRSRAREVPWSDIRRREGSALVVD